LAALLSFEVGTEGADRGTGLFDAYLIAWHHGGSMRLEQSEAGQRIQLILPADPAAATIPDPDATWIADQFSLLVP
jgi:hypothetical protein